MTGLPGSTATLNPCNKAPYLSVLRGRMLRRSCPSSAGKKSGLAGLAYGGRGLAFNKYELEFYTLSRDRRITLLRVLICMTHCRNHVTGPKNTLNNAYVSVTCPVAVQKGLEFLSTQYVFFENISTSEQGVQV